MISRRAVRSPLQHLAGLLAAVLAVAACGQATSSAVKVDRNESITVALPSAIDTLDPMVGGVLLPTYRAIYDQLTTMRPDGTVVPRLATDWQSNADATSWTFNLRKGVKFADGSPLTVEDIIFTYNYILTNSTRAKTYIVQLKTITKLSDTQIRMDLTQPMAVWARSVNIISIVPQAVYKQLGPDGFALHPVGSGPYTVVSVNRAANSAEVKANNDYWGGAPQIQRATLIGVPDATARLNALQSGAVDAGQLLSVQVPTAQGAKNLKVNSSVSNGVAFIGYNVTVAPLGNQALRQAIDLAIDRNGITKSLLAGRATPIGQPVSPVTFGYDPSVKPTTQDVAKAKQLVASSGYKGEKISFQYPTDGWIPLGDQVAQAIQNQLQAIGITLDMKPTTYNDLLTLWANRRTSGMFIFGFQPNTLDADQVVVSLFLKGARNNLSDPEADALVNKQEAQVDSKQRLATIVQLWNLNKEKAYYAPLFQDTYFFAANRSKVAVTPRGDGYIVLQELKFPS